MKVEKIIHTTEPAELEITGATLLSKKEVNLLPMRLRKYSEYWWLRSHSINFSYYIDIVCYYGDIDYYNYVHDNSNAVRPALIIKNLKLSNLKIGDCFYFDDREFEVISNTLAFCKSDIGTYCFREDWKATDANIYEKSDVKKYVDEWFEKAKEENK